MRLFVAVTPPDDVLDVVGALARPPVEGLRWTSRDQWHVTLRFLGRVEDPAPVVDALAGALAGGASPPPLLLPAPVELGPAVDRFGHRVLHVPVSGLEALAGVVVGATAGFGEPPEDRPFSGHLTLARARDRRGVDLRPLCGVRVSATWSVRHVALVESRLHPHGARYAEVARF